MVFKARREAVIAPSLDRRLVRFFQNSPCFGFPIAPSEGGHLICSRSALFPPPPLEVVTKCCIYHTDSSSTYVIFVFISTLSSLYTNGTRRTVFLSSQRLTPSSRISVLLSLMHLHATRAFLSALSHPPGDPHSSLLIAHQPPAPAEPVQPTLLPLLSKPSPRSATQLAHHLSITHKDLLHTSLTPDPCN